MTFDEQMDRLVAAMDRLSANIEAKAGGTPTPVTPPAGKRGPGRPPANKGPTFEEVKAIAERVRDEKSRPEAVDLLKKHGAAKSADLDPSKYASFVAAAEVLLNDTGDEATDEI